MRSLFREFHPVGLLVAAVNVMGLDQQTTMDGIGAHVALVLMIIVISGFMAMTASQRRMIDRLLERWQQEIDFKTNKGTNYEYTKIRNEEL